MYLIYYKRYSKDFLVLLISIFFLFISMFLDEYFKGKVIENKFINFLNEKNYIEASKIICKNKNDLLNNENIQIINFFNGDLNNFYAKDFKVFDKLIVKDSLFKRN
jgi:hypothetical protein